MDIKSRLSYVKQQIDALAEDIDQPHSECKAALEQISVMAHQAQMSLIKSRDAAIALRRSRMAVKEAAAASLRTYAL